MTKLGPKLCTDEDRELGSRLRALRSARGMSQEALGRALGVTFQQIQKYERGTNRISVGRLHAIARVLGVSPTALLTGQDTQEGLIGEDIVRDFLSSAGSSELMESWLAIPTDEGRHLALKLVRATSEPRSADGA